MTDCPFNGGSHWIGGRLTGVWLYYGITHEFFQAISYFHQKLLAANGASLYEENKDGETACDCAIKGGFNAIASFLESRMVFSVSTCCECVLFSPHGEVGRVDWAPNLPLSIPFSCNYIKQIIACTGNTIFWKCSVTSVWWKSHDCVTILAQVTGQICTSSK